MPHHTDRPKSIKQALNSFVYDALRDQGSILGCRMELTPISGTKIQVKVWPPESAPIYFTISTTQHW